jgi:hypothetical protein
MLTTYKSQASNSLPLNNPPSCSAAVSQLVSQADVASQLESQAAADACHTQCIAHVAATAAPYGHNLPSCASVVSTNLRAQ